MNYRITKKKTNSACAREISVETMLDKAGRNRGKKLLKAGKREARETKLKAYFNPTLDLSDLYA